MSTTTSLVSNPSEDRGSSLLTATCVATTLAVAFMITRLVVRAKLIHNVGIDVST